MEMLDVFPAPSVALAWMVLIPAEVAVSVAVHEDQSPDELVAVCQLDEPIFTSTT